MEPTSSSPPLRQSPTTLAATIPASVASSPSLAYSPGQGFANDNVTIRSIDQCITLSDHSLSDLGLRLGWAAEGRPNSYFAESQLRDDYEHVFSLLKAQLTRSATVSPVEIKAEVNLRDVNRRDWDRSGFVRRLRQIFDDENRARVPSGLMQSTGTRTSGTSRKSQKLGPSQPDFTIRVRIPAAYPTHRYTAIGELKFDRQPEGNEADNAPIRDAQLLKGMCQTLWYMSCGGALFGYRLGVFIVNDGFKRFFRLNDSTLAIEVIPHRRRDPEDAEFDVDVLETGMEDPQCRELCLLPHRILKRAGPPSQQSPLPPLSWASDALPAGQRGGDLFHLPSLSRLLRFWAVGLFLAAVDPSDPGFPGYDDLVKLGLEPPESGIPKGKLPIGVEEKARVGRLKHRYGDELSKAQQSSAKRQKRKLGDKEDSPSPPRPGPGPGPGPGSRSDGDSEDKGGGGWRGSRGRGGEERTMPSSREEGAGQQTRGGGEAIQLDVDPHGQSRLNRWSLSIPLSASPSCPANPADPPPLSPESRSSGPCQAPVGEEDPLGAHVIDADTYFEFAEATTYKINRARSIVRALACMGIKLRAVSPEVMDALIARAAAASSDPDPVPDPVPVEMRDRSPLASSSDVEVASGPVTPPFHDLRAAAATRVRAGDPGSSPLDGPGTGSAAKGVGVMGQRWGVGVSSD